MKKFLIILTIAILGVLAFWIFIGFGSNSVTTDSNSGESITLPSGDRVPAPTPDSPAQGGSLSSVVGAGGIVIPTIDFLHASSTGEYPTAGYFYLGYHAPLQGVSDSTATDNPPYVIEYINATQYFNISLLQEPIGQTREEAQQYLMSSLGISQDQMCKLNYMVSVPNRISSQFTGKNLGFSFCPGATVLPK